MPRRRPVIPGPPASRAPPAGPHRTASDLVAAWRFLRTQELLRARGLEFHRHYAPATACSPSRASIFTGQYPSLHGVTQTTGIAKSAFDADMFWLDDSTVPTMGHYFRTTADPLEVTNLAHPRNATPASRVMRQTLERLLVEQSQQKRLSPQSGTVPGMPTCTTRQIQLMLTPTEVSGRMLLPPRQQP